MIGLAVKGKCRAVFKNALQTAGLLLECWLKLLTTQLPPNGNSFYLRASDPRGFCFFKLLLC